jgi:metal-sulfur cluster biosynthetic enzyme
MDLPTLKIIPGQGLPGAVTSHASGGRDVWSDPLPFDPTDPVAAAWDCLREVLDPEIPISLVDLGLIYGVAADEGVIRVTLTYTATACPCMAFIKEDITDRLDQENWVERVEIDEVWDPPWTTARITPEGREKLRALGVGA